MQLCEKGCFLAGGASPDRAGILCCCGVSEQSKD